MNIHNLILNLFYKNLLLILIEIRIMIKTYNYYDDNELDNIETLSVEEEADFQKYKIDMSKIKFISPDLTIEEFLEIYKSIDISEEQILKIVYNASTLIQVFQQQNKHSVVEWIQSITNTFTDEIVSKQYICNKYLDGTCEYKECMFEHINTFIPDDEVEHLKLWEIYESNVTHSTPLTVEQKNYIRKYYSHFFSPYYGHFKNWLLSLPLWKDENLKTKTITIIIEPDIKDAEDTEDKEIYVDI